jgi:hypothetical protein
MDIDPGEGAPSQASSRGSVRAADGVSITVANLVGL